MKRFTLLLILSYLSPYGVAQEVPLYETITDNVPKIGITTEVYLGDRMLEQRTGDYRECIIPSYQYERAVSMRKMGVLVKANQPICKKNPTDDVYRPNYDFITAGGAPTALVAMLEQVLADDETEKTYTLKICQPIPFGKYRCHHKFTEIDINDVQLNERYFLYQLNSFQQTIEYAGKSGNQLKFIYSEFNHGFARDAFTREFQVDLGEGNIAAFKGALIEIEEATNVNIRYKVIRNFQD